MYEFSYISLHVQMTMDLLHIFQVWKWFCVRARARKMRLASSKCFAKPIGLVRSAVCARACIGREYRENEMCTKLRSTLNRNMVSPKPITVWCVVEMVCVLAFEENRKLLLFRLSEWVCVALRRFIWLAFCRFQPALFSRRCWCFEFFWEEEIRFL